MNRGIEEPGRYGAANLFDGDVTTSYCSARGEGLGRVTIDLSSDADAALLPKITRVRVTASPTTPARQFESWLYYPSSIGFGGGRAAGAVGAAPSTFSVERKDLGPSGAAIVIYLRGDNPRRDRGPFCLAEITLLGPAGPVDLPSLSRAVKGAKRRDAELARLTADRVAFARAYLSSFRWSLRNRNKERSDWESASYVFFPDGRYQAETYHISGADPDAPERENGTWSIGKNGKTVLMDGSPVRLIPCRGRGGYLCLGSDLFFPSSGS